MDDTISRKEVLKFLKAMEAVAPGDDLISRSVKATIECARRFVTGMPSVDAVHVVRCGECARRRFCDFRSEDDNGFCSWGVSGKDGENDG